MKPSVQLFLKTILIMKLNGERANTVSSRRGRFPTPGRSAEMDRNDVFEFFYNWGWAIIVIGLCFIMALTSH